ncbi:hypothetical protein CKM354_000255600 [Cercospora kikuchii]|uniref:Methylitaconate delta2-delta3-isomerase n=1 Tax=Cercospora kikuchii TaxID=84275 RepID=A0A9P3FE48_9PEZI|nr:uncharacterized protein CKM354_000255600 [Cercospora kikuchii]GIZ39165.1 hypothetical protein CKM354_000255600 [Cercospora kikuchii]
MAIDALTPPLQRPRKHRQTIPAVWMRAGTSKGLFLHQRDLPAKREQWAPVILAAMGSQDGDPKQLNGVAGATSTTSKVAVIKPSSRPDIDVEYTFVQVSIGSPKLDFTGNCGNIASGVGPFAVDEGLVRVQPGQQRIDVRILNTNTGRTIVESLDLDEDGHFLEDGDYRLAGTKSSGSPIGVSFEKPAGAMTGKLLPTGKPVDILEVPGTITRPSCEVQTSLVDAANPFVLVDAASVPDYVSSAGISSDYYLDFLEAIRCHGAVRMGLAPDIETAGQTRGTPKVALLSMPKVHEGPFDELPDVQVTALSMGKVHGSLQLTGAVCLATAICTEGTIANKIALQAEQWRIAHSGPGLPRHDSFSTLPEQSRKVLIKHPGGTIGADVLRSDEEVRSVKLLRTARRLFEGKVCFLS